MYRVAEKICPLCHRLFKPKTGRQKFCCRNHYMQFYRLNIKVSSYPYYICYNCGHTIELNFHPKINRDRWLRFKCPLCGEPIVNAIKTELILLGFSSQMAIDSRL
jgi:transcription initiation factor IIE alpha subunit